VSLIEWPEKAAGSVPPADVEITLTPSGSGRNASFTPSSLAGQKCLARLADRYRLSSSNS
jgi:tRNA threonylcarbamoyladenosine biosynthesis protein TsaE